MKASIVLNNEKLYCKVCIGCGSFDVINSYYSWFSILENAYYGHVCIWIRNEGKVYPIDTLGALIILISQYNILKPMFGGCLLPIPLHAHLCDAS